MGCWVTTQQDYLDSIGKSARPTTYTLEGVFTKGKGKRAKMALLMHAQTTFASYEYEDYYNVYTADGTDYSRSHLLKDAQDKMAARHSRDGYGYSPCHRQCRRCSSRRIH